MRDAFEREMRAVLRYANQALEPGTSKTEIQTLLKLARGRLGAAASVAVPAVVTTVSAEAEATGETPA